MQTASSENFTWRASRSASEKTATVLIPSSLQAQITRRAISPRFAIRIFLNIIGTRRAASASPDREELLTKFYMLPVLHIIASDMSRDFCFDLVLTSHRFDNAEYFF